MDVGGRCAVEVTKGPYAANWANNVSLAYLFPRDEGQVRKNQRVSFAMGPSNALIAACS